MTNQQHDRDATIDRLLTGRAARGSAESTAACLDAETLAAWVDNSLSAAEMAAAEAHAADCARCQAMLAAMERTAPLAPAPSASAWWMPSLRWLVPVTAAATAVLLWTIVPGQDSRSVNVRQVSERAESPATSVPAGDLRPQASPPSPPPPVADAEAPSAPARDRAARREAPSQEFKEADKKDAESRDGSALSNAPARNADLSRRSAEGAKAESAKAEVRLDKTRAATAEGAAAVAAPAAPAQPMAKTFSFGAPETIIVSSNPASRWRILQGGAVQRSADGGATWQTQNTGVTDTLSGGSSPSPSVCWLVGPKGIVLRTTDGRSWTRVSFPEVVPLSSVRATDDQTATVTAEDGRQFTTGDGGRTWIRKGF